MNFPRAHIEVCKEVQASIKYCQKEDTRVAGPFIRGELPKTKKEAGKKGGEATKRLYEDAFELAKEGRVYDIEAELIIKHLPNLKRIAVDHIRPREFEDTRGVWVVGQPGHGKSHYARTFANDPSEIYYK